MARVGVTKKKPRATALSRVKDKLRRVTEQLESRERELAEATEQQIATGEILRVIASSPTDIQPVLDVVAENAARLCDANDALIYRVDGDTLQSSGGYTGKYHVGAKAATLHDEVRPPAGRSSTAKRFTCMTLRPSLKQSSRTRRAYSKFQGLELFLRRRYFERAFQSEQLYFADKKSVLLPTVISLSSRPSPTRR